MRIIKRKASDSETAFVFEVEGIGKKEVGDKLTCDVTIASRECLGVVRGDGVTGVEEVEILSMLLLLLLVT